MYDLIFSLPFIFAVALTLSVLLYLIGFKIAPKVKETAEKLAPYACGEDLPAEKFQMNIRRFYLYVTYFMVFDISAFMLALSFGSRGFYPTLFIILIMFSLLMLIPIGRGREKRD